MNCGARQPVVHRSLGHILHDCYVGPLGKAFKQYVRKGIIVRQSA